MRNRTKYQKEYYDTSKKLINAKKARRYKKDSDYKNKVRLTSRLNYVKKMLEKNSEEKININGREETLHTIYYMSNKVNRSYVTLLSWVKKGIIPKSEYSNSKGVALYTKSQILYLECLIKKIDFGEVFLTFDKITEIILKFWHVGFSLKYLENVINKESNNVSKT